MFEETIGRLERLRESVDMEFVRGAVADGHPMLKGMKFDPAKIERATHLPDFNQLESAGVRPNQFEAIVRKLTRPPLLVRKDKVVTDNVTFAPDLGSKMTEKIRAVEYMIPSVGRINFRNHSMAWGGTGWVFDNEDDEHLVVVTNRHVAIKVARRTRRGEGVFMFSPLGGSRYGACIDFYAEHQGPSDLQLIAKIEQFTYIADDASADVAFARIRKPSGFQVSNIDLAAEDGKHDELVAVVGYPAKDSQRNDPMEMEEYFSGLYDVKRFSPGKLIVPSDRDRLQHDCTTLGGNSGSPVISLVSKKCVGLHFAGLYGEYNSAVSVSALKALRRGDRPVGVRIKKEQVDAELGNPEGRDGDNQPGFFEGREGFDTHFLDGNETPWPTFDEAQFDLARPTDATETRPHELRYTHFGILYCLRHLSPVVTAVNINGTLSKPYKRKRDKWFFDLRIPKDKQLGEHAYAHDAIDRGHMVRREDPNWGESMEIVKRANYDTFHYTNCSPQHLGLNRNRASWQGLENYILNSSRTHGFKTCVFTGPVFSDADPFLEQDGISLPLEYWKVVVMLAEREDGQLALHATAYLLSQGHLIQRLFHETGGREAVEGFEFGEYKTFQLAITTLEQGTGYDFGPLRNADPLRSENEAVDGKPIFVELDNSESAIL